MASALTATIELDSKRFNGEVAELQRRMEAGEPMPESVTIYCRMNGGEWIPVEIPIEPDA